MRLDIHIHLPESIEGILTRILTNGESIMATLDDVKAALAQAATDATAEKAEVTAAISALNDTITALQAQIASGSVVTAADLDGLLASIQGIDAQVKDITVPVVPAA